MIYGYCRVSSNLQAREGNGLEVQEAKILEKYENAKIYKESYTGTTVDRPVFNEIFEKLEENDMLVVAKLDRLARNTVEGIEIVRKIFEKKASVHVLNVGLLEDSPMGKFFLTTLLAVTELERNQIVERTQSGKAIAKQNPEYREGRPEKYDRDQIEHALDLLKNHSYAQVTKLTGISKSTLIRAKQKEELKGLQ